MDILVCWIGKSDIKASSLDEPCSPGPTAQALRERSFSRVELLSDHPKEVGEKYVNWLAGQFSGGIGRRDVDLHNQPMNIEKIYRVCRAAVEDLKRERKDANLIFHVSPGTPAMAAVWILMSAKYGARLIESSIEHGVNDLLFPFDIAAYFLPDRDLGNMALAKSRFGEAFQNIIGKSPVLLRAARLAERMAPRDVRVLIEGESGTGKELFARAIHNASDRKNRPFIPVNCGAIPRELVESLLFGSKKGSFTGALEKPGFFRAADTGTIFLDEIGELPLDVQVKLLRVLEDGVITPVGDTNGEKVDARVIAATNRNLLEEVAAGNFREDLFYRLAIGMVKLPPLRERGDDVGLLLDNALDEVNRKYGAGGTPLNIRISDEARSVFLRHAWPGNVRELKNTVARAAMWAENDIIDAKTAEEAILRPGSKKNRIPDLPLGNGFNLTDYLSEIERHYVEKAWHESGKRKLLAAELLGFESYQSYVNRLKKFGLDGCDQQWS